MRCYGDVQPLGASSVGVLVSVVPVLITPVRRVLKFGRLLFLARSPALLPILTSDFSDPFNAETLDPGRITAFSKP